MSSWHAEWLEIKEKGWRSGSMPFPVWYICKAHGQICPSVYNTGNITYCWVSEDPSHMLWRALHIHPLANLDCRDCELSASRPGRSAPMKSPRRPINSKLTEPQSPFGYLGEQKRAWNGADMRETPIRCFGHYTYWAIPAVLFLV